MAKKVFVIGLDGATWTIIDPLITNGELPVIKRLLHTGTRAVLKSLTIPASPAVWTSFATGCGPEKHGIIDFAYREKGTYEPIPYTSRDRKCETIWEILSRAGKKVGVLNIPGTYPVDKVNGFMISGLPTPEERGDFTYPRSLLAELKQELGQDFRFQPRVNILNEIPFLEEMKIVTEYVFLATEYLMNRYPWDFLITVFMATDALGHAFWRYMDPKHPLYDAHASQECKQAIFDVYRNLDKRIGSLLKHIDSDTSLILMSDHGFGPLYYGVSINNWLLEQRFLALKNTVQTRLKYWMFRRGANYYNLLRVIKVLHMNKQVSEATYSSKSFWSDLVNRFMLSNNDIDWSRTKVYSMGNGGQFFVNLKGREPQGIVEPNGEYDKVVAQIKSRLRALKDPNTNQQIFTEIYTKKEVFPSSQLNDAAPDVIFFDKDKIYHINRFFVFGSKELISKHPVWSGNHTPYGIFIAHNGGQIRRGWGIDQIGICDITPTVLHLMGLSLPQGMDGAVLRGIFKKGSEGATRKVVYQSHSQKKELDFLTKKITELKKRGKI